jgi:guanosine-3',5'-bis(diphosphate) 3'-pyrophosphohydrolase
VLVAAAQPEQFDVPFAVQVALLHDTLEDTATTLEELQERYGNEVAAAVLALSKNERLPKKERMPDSVARTKPLQKEVAMVRLADRITNLQAPDKGDDNTEIKRYQQESRLILEELRFANQFLANRLQEKIEAYTEFIKD